MSEKIHDAVNNSLEEGRLDDISSVDNEKVTKNVNATEEVHLTLESKEDVNQQTMDATNKDNQDSSLDKGVTSDVDSTNSSSNTEIQVEASQEQNSGSNTEKTEPVYKMGDDVSEITGRPRITKEENEALRSGARFFKKAMESQARARGEKYTPFQLPVHMRVALAEIDREAYSEKIEEEKQRAKQEGRELTQEELEQKLAQTHSAIENLHTINPEEQEKLRKEKEEQARIDAGGARYYGRYQELLKRQANDRETAREKVARNVKVFLIVALCLVGYLVYNMNFTDPQHNTISELKAALPLTIDQHTAMVRIDDRNDEFKIYFEKDPVAYEGLDEHQKEELLNNIVENAPMLCKNPLLNSIISSGKKVTVLLDASDGSFSREYSVDKCPTTESK